MARVTKTRVDLDPLARRLQTDSVKGFVKYWEELMAMIAAKSETLKPTG